MKLTEQDFKYIAKKAVSILREQASLRDVRGIIISNILAKHPGFEGNKDLAWAYYTWEHQRRREGEENKVPEELMARMKEGLRKDKEIKQQMEALENEKAEEAKRAYEEWKSNPDNLRVFELVFNVSPEELETEDGAYEALQRLDKAWQNIPTWVTKKLRTPSGVEFERKWGDPNGTQALKKYKEMRSAIFNKLIEIQTEYGKEHYPTPVETSANARYFIEVDPNSEEEKRRNLAFSDEKAMSYEIELGRCYSKTVWPKYNFSETVDSSD